jgi:uncharacterized protein YndB with AHSA1/START domain
MKWILYLLAAVGGVIVLGLVTLLAMGGGRGESELEASVEIARPARVVFNWITEPTRVKSWVGWMVEIQSLTPGAPAVGSREVWVMEDRNNGNQRMNIAAEITRLEPERLLETRLEAAEGFTGTVTYELQPIDGERTRLRYRGAYKFNHWLARLFEPVISRSAQQKLDEDLARLKQRAEAN